MATMEDCSELPLSCLEVDDSLEDRLQAHGLSRRNVKSMIYSIFADENVVKLLEGDERTELDITYAPVTRSRKDNEIPDDSFEYDISDYISFSAPDVRSSKFPSVADGNTNASSICNNTVKHTVLDADDAYIDENGDFDWKNWLDGIQDEEVTTSNKATTENSDSDPDYHFLEEFEERDEEDYRYDRTTKISQKELKSLHRRRRPHDRSAGGKRCLLHGSSGMCMNGKTRSQIVDSFLKCSTARDKLTLLRCSSNLPIPSKRQNQETKIDFLSFTDEQIDELKQQMQQHVQLLAQSCLMDVSEKTNVKTLLREIECFKTASRNPTSSVFNVSNTNEAIELTDSGPCSTTHRAQNLYDNKGPLISSCIANSHVFMYKELLPQNLDVVQRISNKTKFSYHEDCLIAHGCCEMSSHLVSSIELTQQLLLPCRSTADIRNRIKAVMHGRVKDFTSNPIFKFKKSGVLPEASSLVKKVIHDSVVKPIDMYGELPKWLAGIKSGAHSNDGCDNKTDRAFVPHRKSAKNISISRLGKVSVTWTKEMDRMILNAVKRNDGLTKTALLAICECIPARTQKQIKQRFHKLMKIYSKIESDGL